MSFLTVCSTSILLSLFVTYICPREDLFYRTVFIPLYIPLYNIFRYPPQHPSHYSIPSMFLTTCFNLTLKLTLKTLNQTSCGLVTRLLRVSGVSMYQKPLNSVYSCVHKDQLSSSVPIEFKVNTILKS